MKTVVDTYNDSSNRGLKYKTPNEVFNNHDNQLLSPWMRRAAPGLRVLHPDGWSAGLRLAGNDPIK
jgi:hypothetical protein